MKLSRRSEYGLRALQSLAASYGDGPLPTRDLAESNRIPVKFLEQILLQLKHAGIVHSRRGPSGGYLLAHAPQEITLGKVVRILDGPLAPISCASHTAYERCSCPDESTCGLRRVMLQVRDAVADIMDHTTLADVAHHDTAS
jgi:Rrf2 family protein